MNLVKLITEQLSDQTLGKLGQLLGTDSETASAAASAAVPTLLSSLAGLASRADGAKKLTDTLSGIDSGSMGNFAQLLGGDTSALMQRGSGLLSSLFGDTMISGIANAVSRFSGINVETAKRLLTYLSPMILGKVASQWRSEGGTVGALTNLFADQKRNIADAIPAGLSLADIPGLASVGETTRAAAHSTRRAAETAGATSGSVASWLLPLAVLLGGGFLLWNFLKPQAAENPVAVQTDRDAATTTVMKPVVSNTESATKVMPSIPDVTQIRDNLTGLLTSFTDELGGIKDEASAEAALPKFEQLNTKLDGIRAMWAKLPEASQPAIRELVDKQIEPLTQKADEVAEIPGISDQFKKLIREILQKLTELVAPATATR